MLTVGVVGETPRNGHPFSFSAILNGFDSDLLRKAGWEVIADYLDAGSPSDVGNLGARATQVWFPDVSRARMLQEATGVDSVAKSFDDLVEKVDAVMILRDDWRNNADMALRALRSGKAVFVDKPMSLSPTDLRELAPFLEAGRLMSSSGLRYSPELGKLKANQLLNQGIDEPVFIFAKGPSDWEHNALHLIEPSIVVAKALGFSPLGIDLQMLTQQIEGPSILGYPLPRLSIDRENRDAAPEHSIVLASERLVFVFELSKPDLDTSFRFEIFLENRSVEEFQLRNRLAAFRALLSSFLTMAVTGKPAIDPKETLWCLQRASEGQASLEHDLAQKLSYESNSQGSKA